MAGQRHRLLRALVFSPLLGAAGLAASIGFIAGSIAAACVAVAGRLVAVFSTAVAPELLPDETASDRPSPPYDAALGGARPGAEIIPFHARNHMPRLVAVGTGKIAGTTAPANDPLGGDAA